MRITFLGTGTSQGVPLIGCMCGVCQSADPRDNRLRSSVHVQTDKISLVIDTGPDFRYQMLRAGVRELDAVLFTHGHKDHTAGFDDIRAYNFIQKRDMEVYCDERVDLILHKDFDYVFTDMKYPGVPRANVHRIGNEPFEINGELIIPILVYHYKLPVFGFRIGGFTYITDANYIPDEEFQKISGSDVFVLNALRREEHISHFTLQQAIDVASRANVKSTYFTHISHQLGLHEAVEKELPGSVHLAHDGLQLDI
ncbi:MAG: MBL fold metallo-hydrolase [Flavobacteriales bacterium]|nr:MBL fold metallo-hydrolase [Flavobacteriales bacterium]